MSEGDERAVTERDGARAMVMLLEFNGECLMSQVLPGGAATLKFDEDAHPQHQAVPGEYIEWTQVPGLVLRYDWYDAGAGKGGS